MRRTGLDFFGQYVMSGSKLLEMASFSYHSGTANPNFNTEKLGLASNHPVLASEQTKDD